MTGLPEDLVAAKKYVGRSGFTVVALDYSRSSFLGYLEQILFFFDVYDLKTIRGLEVFILWVFLYDDRGGEFPEAETFSTTRRTKMCVKTKRH